jgi:hypothetical protein
MISGGVEVCGHRLQDGDGAAVNSPGVLAFTVTNDAIDLLRFDPVA